MTRCFTIFKTFVALFCANVLLLSSTFAQQKVVGKVLMPDGKPAELVAVALKKTIDSSFVKGAVAGLDGTYELEKIPAGTYFLEAMMVGFPNQPTSTFEVKSEDVKMPDIQLSNVATNLTAVTVIARKPLIEVQADKTILNVESSVTSAGSNGLEVLRKAPGVIIDNNDNIQLKGNSGVMVYIDDKPTRMTSEELATLLRGIPASDIEAIEIITNPSAKYDAAGNAGIINIRLKKNKNVGTNGSLNTSFAYGKAPKTNVSINLNHRNKQFNIYGNGSIGMNEWHNTLNLYRVQNGGTFDQKQSDIFEQTPVNGKVGADFFLHPYHTIGVLASANTSINKNQWSGNSRTYISSEVEPTEIDSILIANSRISGINQNTNFNLNYRFADTTGHVFSVDADRGAYHATNYSKLENRYTDKTEQILLTERIFHNDAPTDIKIWSFKADYEQSLFNKKAKVATGIKIADVTTENDFQFFDLENGELVKDISKSNRFTYDERVSAAYVNLNAPIGKKASFQAGLRVENTHSIGDLMRDATQPVLPTDYVERDYTDFFPSASFTYNLNPKHSLGATYSRRIDRPNYQDLNPFEWKLDELTYRKGSPFLRPQYSNTYELKYVLLQAATISLGYTQTTDVITDLVEAGDGGESYINYRNLAEQNNFSFSIATPTPIQKWWNGFANLTIYKTYYRADFPEYSFSVQTPIALNFYAEQTFNLPKDFVFEISGWYNSASIWGGNWLTKPQGSLDFGLQKRVLKNNATLKIGVTDVLQTAAPWRAYGDAIPGFTVNGSGTWESRQVRLNFNYRFGNSEIKGERQRQTGLESESGRIKQQ